MDSTVPGLRIMDISCAPSCNPFRLLKKIIPGIIGQQQEQGICSGNKMKLPFFLFY